MFGCNVHQDIVKLEVTVRVPFRVHVSCSAHELLEYVLAGIFGKALVRNLLDMMVDAHTLAQLHD